ncbi:MAG: putative phage integrase [Gammaproteobacteria bacterium]|jgi:integrase|nr:putative phage integrase [Gammaproteobacteria bacterium]
MALYKRNNIWWITISHQGTRIQQSTGTSSKAEAHRLHDKIKAEVWKVNVLKEKPSKDWNDAVLRWCEESQHKKSLVTDKSHLRWLDPHLCGILLIDITRDKIEKIAQLKEKSGATSATVNRTLALIRSILRKAEREWEWLEKAPVVRMRKEDNKRIRWITVEEAEHLKSELPQHLADAMEFALHTGLRASNIVYLEWSEIDFNRYHACIPAHKSKSGKAIAIPLNGNAMRVIKKQMGKHSQFVFSYKGQPVTCFNTKAFRKALKRARIKNFRWHDLRHTWASWHVQNGTSLQELQQLGGWANFEMVLRYAHLSSDHLRRAAERISATNLLQSQATHRRNNI